MKDALHLLTLAGLVTPVKQTDGTGVPLGAEEDDSYVKYLFFDLGIMQTMLGIPSADILLASEVDHHGWRGTIHRTVDEQPLYEREEDAALCMRER